MITIENERIAFDSLIEKFPDIHLNIQKIQDGYQEKAINECIELVRKKLDNPTIDPKNITRELMNDPDN
jgi:hypothetical protein